MTIDINNAFGVEDGLSFEENLLGVFATTYDPSAGAGNPAPIGSIVLQNNAYIFSKIGPNDTDWSIIVNPNILPGTVFNSVNDTTSSYLSTKLTVTTNLTKQTNNSGSNETLLLDLSNTTVIPGNYSKVSVDSKGRVSGGLPLLYSDLPIKLYAENPTSFLVPSALGANSQAFGNSAVAHTDYQQAYSSGSFTAPGDAQSGKYINRIITTDATLTELLIDGPGGSTRMTLQNNSTWTFKGIITAHQTNSTNGHGGWEISGVIYRTIGVATTTIQGAASKIVISRSDPTWDVSVTADTTNGSLKINVHGATGDTIQWVAVVDTVEVTG